MSSGLSDFPGKKTRRGAHARETRKAAVANEGIRVRGTDIGMRKKWKGMGSGGGQQLGTHGVKYLWLRKHVAGPWGQADKEPVCLKP